MIPQVPHCIDPGGWWIALIVMPPSGRLSLYTSVFPFTRHKTEVHRWHHKPVLMRQLPASRVQGKIWQMFQVHGTFISQQQHLVTQNAVKRAVQSLHIYVPLLVKQAYNNVLILAFYALFTLPRLTNNYNVLPLYPLSTSSHCTLYQHPPTVSSINILPLYPQSQLFTVYTLALFSLNHNCLLSTPQCCLASITTVYLLRLCVV